MTNRDQLVAVLRDERFLSGEVSTDLLPLVELARDLRRDGTGRSGGDRARRAAIASDAPSSRGIPVAFRNVVSQPQVTEFEGDIKVEWWGGRDGYVLDGRHGGLGEPDPRGARVRRRADVIRREPSAATVRMTSTGRAATPALRRTPRFVDPADAVASGSLLAPMPGTVVSVAVEQGQQVEAGQPVLVLEAMKMQHTVRAPGRRHGDRDRREARCAGRRR